PFTATLPLPAVGHLLRAPHASVAVAGVREHAVLAFIRQAHFIVTGARLPVSHPGDADVVRVLTACVPHGTRVIRSVAGSLERAVAAVAGQQGAARGVVGAPQ